MITIQIPDDQAEALRAKAAAEGLTLEAWFEKLSGVEPGRVRYKLSELLAQCDPNSPLSEEDLAWLNAPPVGREV